MMHGQKNIKLRICDFRCSIYEFVNSVLAELDLNLKLMDLPAH